MLEKEVALEEQIRKLDDENRKLKRELKAIKSEFILICKELGEHLRNEKLKRRRMKIMTESENGVNF